MSLFRWGLLLVLVGILGMAVYQTILWSGAWGDPYESQVMALKDGDQEIAFIEPATSSDDWVRIVTALELLKIDWPSINPTLPALAVDLDGAFRRRTAEVPEIVLSFGTNPAQHLRLRWYKISGEHDAASWVRKLHQRGRPPLAILGGATSDRALRLANALNETYPTTDEPAPVFLITTATAENTAEDRPLIAQYPKRSFRFSFTNQRMVKALLKFVQQTPDLWPSREADPQAVAMRAVSWEDERYSLDLAELFEREFKNRFPHGKFRNEGSIQYSVGGFFHPAPSEQIMVSTIAQSFAPQTLLVLPTQAVRMRRFLINLRQRSPQDVRRLVILNGDAISFHNVYRDRDVMWNRHDLPFTLIFFQHRNPIERSAGFRWVKEDRFDPDAMPQLTTSGTHDILLYRDVFEAILYAAVDRAALLDEPRLVRERLEATRWHHPAPDPANPVAARVTNTHVHPFAVASERFFDAAGNRRSYTGEHIVMVKPNFPEDAVALTSQISIWASEPKKKGGAWQLVGAHETTYNQVRVEEP